jgi:hypothetical protein
MAESRDWVPELRGWVSFPAAADRLGVARQRVFQMLDERKLTSVRKLPGSGSRPAAYVISDREMERLLTEQREAAGETEQELATAS